MLSIRIMAGACLLLATTLAVAADYDDADTPAAAVAPAARHSEIASHLTLYSMQLMDAPYRMGGADPSGGLDCSGFVQYVYKHVAGLKLPHNAAEQSEHGVAVRKEELKPGDLVFFRTLRHAISHVGIYIGNHQFIHAENSRKGVTISTMDNSYWRKHFDGARRLLKEHLPGHLSTRMAE